MQSSQKRNFILIELNWIWKQIKLNRNNMLCGSNIVFQLNADSLKITCPDGHFVMTTGSLKYFGADINNDEMVCCIQKPFSRTSHEYMHFF